VTARKAYAQAFVEMRVEDPEAESALAVARERLAAGRALADLRRLRLFELAGALAGPDVIAARLHASTQFYNPAKERCRIRTSSADPAPLAANEALVLVFERGGERRPAAERWWRHQERRRVEIREGVVWVLTAAPGADPAELAGELAVLRDRGHGLLANPHVEEHRVCVGEAPPLDWISRRPPAAGRRARRGS